MASNVYGTNSFSSIIINVLNKQCPHIETLQIQNINKRFNVLILLSTSTSYVFTYAEEHNVMSTSVKKEASTPDAGTLLGESSSSCAESDALKGVTFVPNMLNFLKTAAAKFKMGEKSPNKLVFLCQAQTVDNDGVMMYTGHAIAVEPGSYLYVNGSKPDCKYVKTQQSGVAVSLPLVFPKAHDLKACISLDKPTLLGHEATRPGSTSNTPSPAISLLKSPPHPSIIGISDKPLSSKPGNDTAVCVNKVVSETVEGTSVVSKEHENPATSVTALPIVVNRVADTENESLSSAKTTNTPRARRKKNTDNCPSAKTIKCGHLPEEDQNETAAIRASSPPGGECNAVHIDTREVSQTDPTFQKDVVMESSAAEASLSSLDVNPSTKAKTEYLSPKSDTSKSSTGLDRVTSQIIEFPPLSESPAKSTQPTGANATVMNEKIEPVQYFATKDATTGELIVIPAATDCLQTSSMVVSNEKTSTSGGTNSVLKPVDQRMSSDDLSYLPSKDSISAAREDSSKIKDLTGIAMETDVAIENTHDLTRDIESDSDNSTEPPISPASSHTDLDFVHPRTLEDFFDVKSKKKEKQVEARRDGHRSRACRECVSCLAEDCQSCAFCYDMKRYGGPGKLKQKCRQRRCINMSRKPLPPARVKPMLEYSKADSVVTITPLLDVRPNTPKRKVNVNASLEQMVSAKVPKVILDDAGTSANEKIRREMSAVRKLPNCGHCSNCQDKKQFGGPNKKRQMCAVKKIELKRRVGKIAPANIDRDEDDDEEKSPDMQSYGRTSSRKRKLSRKMEESLDQEWTGSSYILVASHLDICYTVS